MPSRPRSRTSLTNARVDPLRTVRDDHVVRLRLIRIDAAVECEQRGNLRVRDVRGAPAPAAPIARSARARLAVPHVAARRGAAPADRAGARVAAVDEAFRERGAVGRRQAAFVCIGLALLQAVPGAQAALAEKLAALIAI